jgi:prepilin-type N-terminal cleavage/methylation domain-containing protein/prepilin-type processing-associated H-X9-DG protein
MRSRSRAFTLIELLTVIAIIGVLAAIIIGSVSKVRDAARRSTCVSNLRQIGTAFPLYAADNRGLYPAARLPIYTGSYSSSNPPPGANPSLNNWQVEISRYIMRGTLKINGVENGGQNLTELKNTGAQSNIAHCPSFDLFFANISTLATTSNLSTAGYGMNKNLNVAGFNTNTSDTINGGGPYTYATRFPAVALNNPATSILVGDSSEYYLDSLYQTSGWTLATDTDPTHLLGKPDGYLTSAPKRHGPTANYLFADGHVASLTPEAALIASAFRK